MFHVIIAKENRVSTQAKPRALAIQVAAQLHDLGVTIQALANPNLLSVIEWDMVSPYVVVHKGVLSDYKMAYAGWPMIDQTTYLANQAV